MLSWYSAVVALVVEQSLHKKSLSATVDRIPLGTTIYIDILNEKERIFIFNGTIAYIDRVPYYH